MLILSCFFSLCDDLIHLHGKVWHFHLSRHNCVCMRGLYTHHIWYLYIKPGYKRAITHTVLQTKMCVRECVCVRSRNCQVIYLLRFTTTTSSTLLCICACMCTLSQGHSERPKWDNSEVCYPAPQSMTHTYTPTHTQQHIDTHKHTSFHYLSSQ